MTNGIWLCQNCAKLVDSDEPWYTEQRIRAWKMEAEEVARIELEMRVPAPSGLATRFARLEGFMPELLAEMRTDLAGSPTFREFALLRRAWSFWGGGQMFAYYYEDHPNLDSQVRILWNEGFVTDISSERLKKFVLSEDLVDYLNGSPGQ